MDIQIETAEESGKVDEGSVVITGASGGIGAAFARRLASEGRRMVLIARRPEPLEALAGRLRSGFGARCEVAALDLATEAGVAQAEDLVAEMPDLAVLVNSAGFATSRRFAATALETQSSMIMLHVMAPTRLCHAVLPGMIARGKGAIINVASFIALFPLPGNVTYAGTKAYLVAFSQALQPEVRRDGIRIQALCPGFTRTGFHDTSELRGFKRSSIPTWLWSDPGQVVESSLRSLRRDQVVCIPGLANRLVQAAVRLGFGPMIIHRMFGRRLAAPEAKG